KGIVVATAAAALFASGAVKARAEEKAGGDNVKCVGINECKGKSACAGGGNSCSGQNSCKGKGMVVVPKAECEKKGGKVVSCVGAGVPPSGPPHSLTNVCGLLPARPRHRTAAQALSACPRGCAGRLVRGHLRELHGPRRPAAGGPRAGTRRHTDRPPR